MAWDLHPKADKSSSYSTKNDRSIVTQNDYFLLLSQKHAALSLNGVPSEIQTYLLQNQR